MHGGNAEDMQGIAEGYGMVARCAGGNGVVAMCMEGVQRGMEWLLGVWRGKWSGC